MKPVLKNILIIAHNVVKYGSLGVSLKEIKMNVELFSTWTPLSLVKGLEEDDEFLNRAKIGGIISTESVDQQGDVLLQDGLDFSYLMSKGYFNYEHKNGVEFILGSPTRIERTMLKGKPATKIEGFLMLDRPLAKEIFNTVQAMEKSQIGRNVGFSVEGQVLARDKMNPKVVTKARILNVAITGHPVNPDTKLEVLARSLMMKDSKMYEDQNKGMVGHQSPSTPDSTAPLSPVTPSSTEEQLSIQDIDKDMKALNYDRMKEEMGKMMKEEMEKMYDYMKRGDESMENPMISNKQLSVMMKRVFPQLSESQCKSYANKFVKLAKMRYNQPQ
tara:strand:- start:8676 stop:9665 length:990 start_codon:yes stop_codon:yes gene_type:complete